jgi:hypothetical protein
VHHTIGSELSDRSFADDIVGTHRKRAYRANDQVARPVNTMDAARGLMIAMGLSAVCWAGILTVVWKLIY